MKTFKILRNGWWYTQKAANPDEAITLWRKKTGFYEFDMIYEVKDPNRRF